MTDPDDDLLATLEQRHAPRPTTRAEFMVYLAAAVLGSVLVMSALEAIGLW